MNQRLQVARAKHDQLRTAIETIETGIAERGDDATEDEAEKLRTLAASADDVATSIRDIVEREDRLRATDEILARVAPQDSPHFGTLARTNPVLPTPGEYATDFLRAVIEKDKDAQGRIEAVRAMHLRTVANQTIADNAGIVPTLIVGDLTKFVDASRPVINVMRDLPMPQVGKTFTRPRVTQTTQSAVQTNEMDQLNSRKMTITGDTVTKSTHGGVLNLSEQDIDWTDPALLQIVSEDLAEAYAIDTEATAEAAIAAAITTNKTNLEADATAAVFQAAIASAAGSVYATAKALPDVLFCAVDRWAYLAGLTDTTGRPIFPNLNPVNASGELSVTSFQGNPLSLKLAVGPAFSAGFMAVGVSRYLESYEQAKGLLTIEAPSTLSVTMAYRGYYAVNIHAQALQGLVDPTP